MKENKSLYEAPFTKKIQVELEERITTCSITNSKEETGTIKEHETYGTMDLSDENQGWGWTVDPTKFGD